MTSTAKEAIEGLQPYLRRPCLLEESSCIHLVQLDQFTVDARPDGDVFIKGQASPLSNHAMSYSRIRPAEGLHEKDKWITTTGSEWHFAVPLHGVHFMGRSYLQFSYMYGSVRLYFNKECIDLHSARSDRFIIRFFEWFCDYEDGKVSE